MIPRIMLLQNLRIASYGSATPMITIKSRMLDSDSYGRVALCGGGEEELLAMGWMDELSINS